MDEALRPTTIQRLSGGIIPAFAMLAGAQLELFSALAEAPLGADALAARLGVDAERLSRLLYALTATGLLELRDGRFANSAEADAFLVKGRPDYLGDQHTVWSDIWRANLATAESIRTGAPQ